MEALLRFKEKETVELSQEVVGLRQQKNLQISQLQEQVDEYKQLYNKQRQAAVELHVLKNNQVRLEDLQKRNENLENELGDTRRQLIQY